MAHAARTQEGLTWDRDLRIARFEVVRRTEAGATVAPVLPRPYLDITPDLRSTEAGRGVDDSNAIPFGH